MAREGVCGASSWYWRMSLLFSVCLFSLMVIVACSRWQWKAIDASLNDVPLFSAMWFNSNSYTVTECWVVISFTVICGKQCCKYVTANTEVFCCQRSNLAEQEYHGFPEFVSL